MSIVALKRNSERYINPISHNQGNNGFALNGGLRNVGWVGQTSLSRIGSTSSFCTPQDSTIVKKSTLNTSGYLSSRVRYPVSAGCATGKCDPLTITMDNNKKVAIMNDHTASGQTAKIANDGINACTINCNANNSVINNPAAFKATIECPPEGCKTNSYYIGGRLVYNTFYNKDVSSFTAMSAGDYIQRKKKPVTLKYK